MTELKVTGCSDCPCCDENFTLSNCQLARCKDRNENHYLIEQDDNLQLTTPLWCPLKQGSITLKMEE